MVINIFYSLIKKNLLSNASMHTTACLLDFFYQNKHESLITGCLNGGFTNDESHGKKFKDLREKKNDIILSSSAWHNDMWYEIGKKSPHNAIYRHHHFIVQRYTISLGFSLEKLFFFASADSYDASIICWKCCLIIGFCQDYLPNACHGILLRINEISSSAHSRESQAPLECMWIGLLRASCGNRPITTTIMVCIFFGYFISQIESRRKTLCFH